MSHRRREHAQPPNRRWDLLLPVALSAAGFCILRFVETAADAIPEALRAAAPLSALLGSSGGRLAVASLLALLLGAGILAHRSGKRPLRPLASLDPQRVRWALALLLGLALAARLYHFAAPPFGLADTERWGARRALVSWQLWKEQGAAALQPAHLKPFTLGQILRVAQLVLLEAGATGIRWGTAWIPLLSGGLLFLLGRRWFSASTGLLAAGIIGFALPELWLSGWALEPALITALIIGFYAALDAAMAAESPARRAAFASLAGLLLAGGLSLSPALRGHLLLILGLLLSSGLASISSPGPRRTWPPPRRLAPLLATLIAALFLGLGALGAGLPRVAGEKTGGDLPRGLRLLTSPEEIVPFARWSSAWIWRDARPARALQRNLLRSVALLTSTAQWPGPWGIQRPGKPLLNTAVAFCFWIGLGLLLFRRPADTAGARRRGLLLAWLLCGWLPALLTDQPEYRRYCSAMPAAYLLAALGLERLLGILRSLLPATARRWTEEGRPAGLLLVLLLIGAANAGAIQNELLPRASFSGAQALLLQTFQALPPLFRIEVQEISAPGAPSRLSTYGALQTVAGERYPYPFQISRPTGVQLPALPKAEYAPLDAPFLQPARIMPDSESMDWYVPLRSPEGLPVALISVQTREPATPPFHDPVWEAVEEAYPRGVNLSREGALPRIGEPPARWLRVRVRLKLLSLIYLKQT
jgi:hypothetical protein